MEKKGEDWNWKSRGKQGEEEEEQARGVWESLNRSIIATWRKDVGLGQVVMYEIRKWWVHFVRVLSPLFGKTVRREIRLTILVLFFKYYLLLSSHDIKFDAAVLVLLLLLLAFDGLLSYINIRFFFFYKKTKIEIVHVCFSMILR